MGHKGTERFHYGQGDGDILSSIKGNNALLKGKKYMWLSIKIWRGLWQLDGMIMRKCNKKNMIHGNNSER